MKTYKELFEEIRESMKNGGKCTFSKEQFTDLARAYLNDTEAVVKVAKTKNGEMFTEETNVVKDFRKMIERILIDFGVDKQEASKVIEDYQFTNVDAMYGVCSELIYNYVDAGKKFTFIPKEDCVASLTIKEYEDEVKYNKNPKDPEAEPVPTLYKKHKKMKVESLTPSWLKEIAKK